VNQAFDVVFDAGKGAEFGQAGNGALNQLTNLILGSLVTPRILKQLANGQADAFLVAVDGDDLDLDVLPDFENFTGMLNAVPGDFGEMNQTIGAANVDESAKLGQAGNAPGADFALG